MTKSVRPFHLHVGLGRIGMGLVLGMIRKEIPLIILQRRNAKWNEKHDIFKKKLSIRLTNNVGLDRLALLRWVNQDCAQLRGELDNSNAGTYLLIYNDLNDLKWLPGRCSSMSTSMQGQEELQKWLNLPDVSGGMTIYPFENTITLASTAKYRVNKVIPDRICAEEPDYCKTSKSWHVKVEEHADVVFNASETECKELFSWDQRVKAIVTESDQLFTYRSKRKLFLVNGLHNFVATFCYKRLMDDGVRKEDWKAQYMPTVIKSILHDRCEIQHYVDVLIGAQAMRLVLVEAAKLKEPIRSQVYLDGDDEQLYMRLLNDGYVSLDRFRNVTDLLFRVVGLDKPDKFLANYKKHVRGLRSFVTQYRVPIDVFPARLKPWVADIDQVVQELIDAEQGVWNELLKGSQS